MTNPHAALDTNEELRRRLVRDNLTPLMFAEASQTPLAHVLDCIANRATFSAEKTMLLRKADELLAHVRADPLLSMAMREWAEQFSPLKAHWREHWGLTAQ